MFKCLKFKNFLILTSLFLAYNSVFAATLYFNSPLGNEAGVGQVIPVDIFLNADGENLNAVETEIQYPKDLLKPVSFSDGSSIVSLWLERPNLEKDTLSLKGVIPGGFNWQRGLIGRINFEAVKAGEALLRFGARKVFLNDGLGNEGKVVVKDLAIKISTLEKEGLSEAADQYPPEKFQPEVIQDLNIYDGQYILVFATQDKQSGIDHYEILEFRSWNIEFRKILGFIPYSRFQIPDSYEIAESPYLLRDQTRESYIYIKAVDRAGNERMAKIYPISYRPWYRRPITYYIIVALLLVLAAIAIRRLRRSTMI